MSDNGDRKNVLMLINILDDAISLERNARQFYISMSHKAENPEGKRMFRIMADFEEGHELELIARRREVLSRPEMKGMPAPPINIEEELCETDLVPGSPSGDSVEEIINFGIEIEKAAKKYYEEKLSKAGNEETMKLLSDLALEEEMHVRVLKEQLKNLDASRFEKDMEDIEKELGH